MRRLRNLLVVGLDVASLASSAKNAGYSVFSVDYFGDTDLRASCLSSSSIVKQGKNVSCGHLSLDFDLECFVTLTKSLLEKWEVDGILLSSGLEDYPQILSAVNELAPIVGNSVENINRVRDNERFFAELTRIGVPHPETGLVWDAEDAKRKAQDIGYPVVVKPEKGCGGFGLRKATNPRKLEEILGSDSFGERFLIQEYVEGKATSTAVISTATNTRTVAVNEQFLGLRSLGQLEPFGYCGNITPLEASEAVAERCREAAEKVVEHYRLVGSNGVDILITEEGMPKVIEVNPRFQGSLECIEHVLGINLVKAHIEASMLGVLPDIREVSGFCARFILYALKRSKIPAFALEGVRDIPFEGAIVEKGEPLCSVITEGQNRTKTLQEARRLANAVYHSIL